MYELKMIRKENSTAIWRLGYVPIGITFTQLALIIDEMLEIQPNECFEFEFFHKKELIGEERVSLKMRFFVSYHFINANETYIDDWFKSDSDDCQWFNFRTVSPEGYYRVYRCEIGDEVNLEVEGEPCNYPVLGHTKGLRDDPQWPSDIYSINDRLRKYFTFHEIDETCDLKILNLSDEVYKHGMGLLVNTPDGGVASAEGTPSDKLADECHRPYWEFLMSASEDDLRSELANDYDITAPDSMDKKSLCMLLAARMIILKNIKQTLLTATDDSLDLFESILDDGYREISQKESGILAPFIHNHYAFIYKGSSEMYVVIPDEVADAYRKISSDGYRELHHQSLWLVCCELCFAYTIGYGPISVFMDMYKQNPVVSGDFDEMMRLHKFLPDYCQSIVISNDTVYGKNINTPSTISYVADAQAEHQNLDYYIADIASISRYSEGPYPFWEKSYEKLHDFLKEKIHLSEQENYDFCKEVYYNSFIGATFPELMDTTEAEPLMDLSDKETSKLLQLCINAHFATRQCSLKGHTPPEAGQTSADSYIDTPELTDIMPFGPTQQPVVKSKKIYPNDPCPCGSGKKYKNCCGRKKK